MASLSYLHGIETIEVNDGIRPIQTVQSAVIGLIGTAPDRDTTKYPINTPALIAGNPRGIADWGQTGTIPDALNQIFAQSNPIVVIIPVDPGVSTIPATLLAQTYANIVGNPTSKTGVWAFTKSSSVLKLVPKLLIAPGYTAHRPVDGLASIAVNTGGTGYTAANTSVTITGGGGQGATAIAVFGSTGNITAIELKNFGFGYTTVPTVTIVGDGTAATATATLGAVANPVAVELVAVAPFLRAMAIVDGPGTTYADAVQYRGDFDSDRVKIIDGNWQVFDTTTATNVVQPCAASAAGLQAQIDGTNGFWFDFSNWPVAGVVGTGRPIDWSYYDSSVEGQLLNSQDIAVAVSDGGGFKIMGVRTPTSDPTWQFWSVRRTADMVYESIEQALRSAIDKPISAALIDWIEASINSYLGILVQRGAILGGNAWIDRTLNTAAQLAGGQLVVDFDLEPPAPLERLTFRAHRNAGYYTDLINQVTTVVA